MAQKRGYRNGGNRKLARAEKRKRYYQRHPDKEHRSTKNEGHAWRAYQRAHSR